MQSDALDVNVKAFEGRAKLTDVNESCRCGAKRRDARASGRACVVASGRRRRRDRFSASFRHPLFTLRPRRTKTFAG